MLNGLAEYFEISVQLMVSLLVLVAIQLTVQVYALLDLVRRNDVRGGNKWLWLAAIVAGNLIGTVVYLVIGRSVVRESTNTGRPEETSMSAQRAADVLYGKEGRGDRAG